MPFLRSSDIGKFIRRRPVLTIFLISLAVRLALAVGAVAFVHGSLVPDEAQYLGLAEAAFSPGGSNQWFPEYGPQLFRATATFMVPVSALFWLFGPHRLLAHVVAVLFGGIAAAVTTRLALVRLEWPWAFGAGLLTAVLPSQIFWSSVVLRESAVWATLAAVALGMTIACRADTRARVAAGLGVIAIALIGLGFLRHQTFLVAAWVVAIAGVALGGRDRLARAAVLMSFAVFLPIVVGLGPAGWELVVRAVPSLARTRTNLGLEASSAFVELQAVATTATSPSSAGAGGRRRALPRRRSGPAETTVPLTTIPGKTFIGRDGNIYQAEEGVESSLYALPRGLVAVTVRPFPWESSSNLGLLLARIETVVWDALYVLATIGAVAAWRDRSVTLFPILTIGGVIAVAAITQGNLGTAFRHRGQVLWALALIGAFGARALHQRYVQPKP